MISMIYAIFILLITLQELDAGLSCSKEEMKNVENWNTYKTCYKRSFHPEEDMHREKIFKQNVEKVKLLNAQKRKVKYGMNGFSHMTHHEFKSKYLGTVKSKPVTNFEKSKFKFDGVDWRTKGYVTKVKNQKMCGSCYAFSAVGAIEGLTAKKNGSVVSLSVEQLVDCSRSYGNNGCNGGLMENVFLYVRDNGLMTSHDYPYKGKETKCEFDESRPLTYIKGFESVPSGNETALTEAILKNGPVSVAIDAGQESLMFYSEGVYKDDECSSTDLNHGVLVVGVTKDYYIVKNSWGSMWGENGYMKIARNRDNLCGVATDATYPV